MTGATWFALIFALLAAGWAAWYTFRVRKKLTAFAARMIGTLDDMLHGNAPPVPLDGRDDLFAKIDHRLARLYQAMEQNNRRVAQEQLDLQQLVSDISHQVKMPIANLKAVCETLQNPQVPDSARQAFLRAMDAQLDKLDFLMQAMIKMSRLETGVIALEKKNCPVHETLALALGGIFLAAQRKGIAVSVDCPEHLTAYHDRKWTAEALLNILDNAVKYTPPGGAIGVTVARQALYTVVAVSDTGKGIPESRQAQVFKRFYREPEVHDVDGIGIGLYLAREIAALQGGYIGLASEPGKGAVFSVFLPNT